MYVLRCVGPACGAGRLPLWTISLHVGGAQTATLSRVMLGEPTKLESRFRLTYLMILSLLRVQELRVQDMMRRSFSEFASQADLPQQRLLAKQARKSLRALERIDCPICAPDLPAYYDANADVLALNRRLQETVLASPAGTKALVPGRLLVVTTPVRPGCVIVGVGSVCGCVIAHQGHLQAAPNAVAAVLRTDTKGGKRVVVVVTLIDAAATTVAAAIPRPGALPMRSVHVPAGPASCRVDEVVLGDVVVLGKNRIKLEPPRAGGDKYDARELAALTQQLLQVAQESRQGMGTPSPARLLLLGAGVVHRH